MTRIGILAFQGDFREHALAVERLGAESRLVRLPRDLEGVDGLILPGGESTVMGKLMIAYDVVEPLRSQLAKYLAIPVENFLLARLSKHVCTSLSRVRRERSCPRRRERISCR